MAAGEDLRVSDAERDRAADGLRRHASQGRLTVDELAERLERVYAARTGRDLGALVHDLPDLESGARRRRRGKAAFRTHLGWFAAVNGLLVVLWALGGGGEFWPVWPLLGWGVGLGAHARCRPRGGADAYGSTRPRRIA
jgi:hypothetical protein